MALVGLATLHIRRSTNDNSRHEETNPGGVPLDQFDMQVNLALHFLSDTFSSNRILLVFKSTHQQLSHHQLLDSPQ
jgi:hypothetical protein